MVEADELNLVQIAILEHTIYRAASNLYCGDSPDMRILCESGFMEYVGRKPSVPDPYFKITLAGRLALQAAEKDRETTNEKV